MGFFNGKLTISHIKDIEHMLSELESIAVYDCPEHDFYNVFLKHCTSLKNLMIRRRDDSPIIGNGNEWLSRHIPTLEHFCIFDFDSIGSDIELKTFFEQNKNVHIFSTTFNIMWQNRNWMLESNIKIDRIDISYPSYSRVIFNHVCELLSDLHEKRFYRRLHVYIRNEDFEQMSGDQEIFNSINLLPAPERLA